MKFQVRMVSILCVAIAAISGCWGSDCRNFVIKESASPDGKRAAVVFSRDYGATTDSVQAVEIHETGTVFSSNDPSKYIFTMRGEHKIDIQWLASDHLKIDRPRNRDDISYEKKEWNGVSITYEPE
ncbi:hypothetical protein [Massilia sp. Root418]|uniref:hypothetical protein n=1 Tax=Massilia sp. Root418 TaxID=1736532 RepID=UPI0012F65BA1|nr:hypothetical protein [Massilia sp. Root418]